MVLCGLAASRYNEKEEVMVAVSKIRGIGVYLEIVDHSGKMIKKRRWHHGKRAQQETLYRVRCIQQERRAYPIRQKQWLPRKPVSILPRCRIWFFCSAVKCLLRMQGSSPWFGEVRVNVTVVMRKCWHALPVLTRNCCIRWSMRPKNNGMICVWLRLVIRCSIRSHADQYDPWSFASKEANISELIPCEFG